MYSLHFKGWVIQWLSDVTSDPGFPSRGIFYPSHVLIHWNKWLWVRLPGRWSPIPIHALISQKRLIACCLLLPLPCFATTKASSIAYTLHLSPQPWSSRDPGRDQGCEAGSFSFSVFQMQGISKELITNQRKEPQFWLCSPSAVCIFYIMHGPGAPTVRPAGYNHNQSIPTYF